MRQNRGEQLLTIEFFTYIPSEAREPYVRENGGGIERTGDYVKTFLGLVLTLTFPAVLHAVEASVSGTITDSGEPVARAMVVLQRLRGRDCAEAFEKKKPSQKTVQKLASCSEDLVPTHTDEQGSFRYGHLEPDWYAIRILWPIKTAPGLHNLLCQHGEWVVGYYTRRDSTGKYNAMAQGHAFQLADGKQKTTSFSYDKPLGTQGKCLTPP